MTTAYTSLLGLALPVTGELSGTWGDVVNNSITGLLDTAIAGTTTLSTDADVTLSTTTGAANQSRQAIILWTASGTVTRTITAPAQSKIYTIINRSSTQSIKIVGVGPTTGVTVKSGATVTVAWNGLDFVEISVSTLYPTVTISGNMDNGTTDNSLNNAPTVKSAVTTLASVYLSNPSTEAASFTLTSLVGYRAEQGTFGASSTVTNQYGFYANSDLTGAQFNYGLYSGIAATAASTITSINGTGSTVTVDTSGSHGLVTGDSVIIAGVSNTTMTAGSYNGGPYTITLVDADTFTYSSSATSSAAVTSGGSVVKSNNWNIYAGGTGNNWFGGPTVKSVSSVLPALRITQTGTGDALLVEDSTNPDSTPFVVDNSGNAIQGYTALLSFTSPAGTLTPTIQSISQASSLSQGISSTTHVSSANGPNIVLGKSRGASASSPTIVSSGDISGNLIFNGYDGATYLPTAYIQSIVDGTPGTNDMPGRLVFSTTADGASSPTERMRIDSAGQTKFSYNAVIETTDNTNAALRITQLGTGNALLVEDSANPDSTPFVIDASGYVVIGTTTRLTTQGTSLLQTNTTSAGANFGANRFSSTTSGAEFNFSKSDSDTIGTNTIVASGDTLGLLSWSGADGTGYIRAAQISAAVDGTPGTNDMPGRLVFSTTADGASSPTERMRIDSAGRVGIGVTPQTGRTFTIGGSMTGATGAYGSLTAPTVQPDVTANALISSSQGATAANGGTPYTIATLVAYTASQGTFNADSTVTTQVGFDATAALIGATNNYGFRGNIASGTGRYNLYMSGTADNYLAGKTGIGTTPATAQILRVGGSLTGGTTARQIASVATVASDVTTRADTFLSLPATAASAFTLGILSHYHASQGTIGATSAVTNQFGFEVDNTLTGATNNYGFYGNLASASGAWNLYMTGSANNYLAGALGIGSTSVTNVSLRVSKNITGATTSYGMYNDGTVQSDVTTTAYGYRTNLNTQATAFTLGSLVHYGTQQGTIGATSAVTNQYGFIVGSDLTGATNNYGFYGNIASGSNRWNFYAAGTADNYFAGNVWIGQTSQVWDEKLGVRLATSGSGTVGLGVYSASTTYASSMIRVQAETGGSGWKMYEGRANGGSQLFWVDGSGGAYFAGNVGIGTSSPSYKLQVAGSIKETQSSEAATVGNVQSTFAASFQRTSTDTVFNIGYATTPDAWVLSASYGTTGAYKPIAFATSDTERMRIDSSGNVGIGATSPTSTTKFYVEQSTGNVLGYFNSTAASQNARVRINSTDTASSVAYVWSYSNASLNKQASIYLTSAGALATQVGQTAGAEPTTGTTAMFIDSSGNVGIGTSSPSRKFDVAGSARFIQDSAATTGAITLRQNTGDTVGGYIQWVNNANTSEKGWMVVDTSSNMLFATISTERMRIDSSGNVQVQSGAVMPYAPAPASISTTATLTNANIQAQIINTTGTTYTVTMPLGTTLETLATWATTNIGYDFFVINTASGTITMAVNTGVTSLGTLTIATGVSAQFRIRRTAANTFVLYRLG